MGARRGYVAAVAAVLLSTAVAASSAWGASLRVLIRHTPNQTDTNRTAKTIDGIVIHDTEGRFIGSVRALQNAGRDASAHFVVSRRGQVVQLVPVTDVAWHAGNSWWNLHSIGIEHEGWAGRRDSYTPAEYRASAELVAYLAHRWGIPLDRHHIIGHYQVPDPYHHGLFGGFAHHTDPGRFWNWRLYMSLVRWYAKHPVLPHFVHAMTLHDSPPPGATLVRDVPSRPTVEPNARLRGKAVWWSGVDASQLWRRHIWKVDFLVDGRLLYSDHTWPFSFHRTVGWDTRTVANGHHMLTVRAYGADHYRTRTRIPVRVDNPPLRVRVTGAVSGGAVSGELRLSARVNGGVARVVLYADGKAVSRDATFPYSLAWNTTLVGEGEHQLLVYARDSHGHRAALRLPVVVANDSIFPAALSRNWVTHHVVVVGADLAQ